MAKLNLTAIVRRSWRTSTDFLSKRWRWVVASIILVLVALALLYFGYNTMHWTGFGGREDAVGKWIRYKTLWDWMDLLIVPVLLAGAAFLLNRAANRRALKHELVRAHEEAWQAYLDQMTALLLRRRLRKSGPDDEVRCIARVRTLAVLRQLDGEHRGYLMRFLYEATLIEKQEPLVVLDRADLSEINLVAVHLEKSNLKGAYLEGADLGFAKLSGANLSWTTLNKAILRGTDFSGTDLSGASLTGADLTGADLTGANLSGAIVTDEQLAQTKSLDGATLPDGTKYASEAEPGPTEPDVQDAEEQSGLPGGLDAAAGSAHTDVAT